jgi:hypothetical protein
LFVLFPYLIYFYFVKDKNAFSSLCNPKVQLLLKHWYKSEVKLSEARDKWLENSPKCWTSIANFKQKKDRDALCKYAISGELLESQIGNSTMFSLPNEYIGKLALNEFVFEAINFDKLMEIRIKNVSFNIVECAIEYLRSSIYNLRNHIINRTIVIDIYFDIVDLTKKATLSKIASFNPSTISWSNICDYSNYSDFHEMCRKCSSSLNNRTIHYLYSMNWPSITYGSTHIDYINQKNVSQVFFEESLNKTYLMISEIYEMLDYKKILLYPPIDDMRNLLDDEFFMQTYERWVKFFLSKSNIDNPKQQAFYDKSIYNLFSHTNSTIYIVICYDSNVEIKHILS